MNKFVLIPDSFKGTMDSVQVCEIMERAVRTVYPDAEVSSIPVADGGEGSVDCFLHALGGELVEHGAHGPLMDTMTGRYGLIHGGATAVIEMAACAGLPLIEDRKDPLGATTFGVGEQIADALGRGVREIVVGLGGSATNDGGCGAACACGVRFYDRHGAAFVPGGGTLLDIDRIDLAGRLPAVAEARIVAMCDIDNPMYGETGAAHVFGPQKGADAEAVELIDRGLRHLAAVAKRDLGVELDGLAGGGAAGAMGAGMVAFFGASLQMGIETVLDTVDFERVIADADLILTGEGRMDSQSLRGKVVIGVARRAAKLGKPVVAVVGDALDPLDAAFDMGVSAVFPINRVAKDFAQIRKQSPYFLEKTVENIVRLCGSMGL